MGKVLVLGSDTRSFLAVVRSLGRRGITVHVGWCPDHSAARRSRYIAHAHDIPAVLPGSDTWKRALIALMQREKFDLVIPCDDPTLIPLQLHGAELKRFGPIYLLDDHAFDVVFDKVRSYDLAVSLGISVPRGIALSSPSEVDRIVSSFSLPAVIKPRATFAPGDLINRRSVRRARARDELARSLRGMLPQGPVLVQEYFTGIGAGVELLADAGEVLVAFQHIRVHEPPVGGGSSYRKSVPLTPELADAAATLIRALNYTGVAMVEFKVDGRSGAWAFMEINGRFWGSLPLAVAAGADFPYYLYRMIVHGERAFPQRYRTGLYCRNLLLDAVWMVQNARADRSDPTLITVPPRQLAGEIANLLTLKERSDTLVIDDMKPGLIELVHAARVLWTRAAGKIGLALLALPPVRKLYTARARRALRQARSILFVCKGNICRSPFAQRYARALLPDSVMVTSCGYYPKEGRMCPDEAVAAARTVGVDLATHRSAVLSEAMVRDAEVIFAFDEEDLRTLRTRYPHIARRTYLLGLFASGRTLAIRDPYGYGSDVFDEVYGSIAGAIKTSLMSRYDTTPLTPADRSIH